MESGLATYGTLASILVLISIVYAVVLFVLPFAVISINKKVKRTNELLGNANELLESIMYSLLKTKQEG